MVATKSQDTAGALEALRAAAPASTPVVCLQNAVENERIALRLFANVYGAVVMSPTAHLKPGIVQSYGTQRTGVIDVGRYPEGLDALSEEIAQALGESDFSSVARPDIMRFKHAKLLGNLANAVDAICEPGPAAGEVIELAQQEGRAALNAAGHRVRRRRRQRGPSPVGAARRPADRRPRARRLLDPPEHRPRDADGGDRLPERRDRAARSPAPSGDPGQRRSVRAVGAPRARAPGSPDAPRRRGAGTRTVRTVRGWTSSSLTPPPRSPRGQRASSRRWWPCPRPRGTSREPRKRSHCAPRSCRRRPRSSASRARRPGAPMTWWRGSPARDRAGCCCSGHVDTVIEHASHAPLRRDGNRLYGPGTVDMKGGDVLALGVARALAPHPELFAEVALLLVTDEEWRRARVPPHRAVRLLRRLPVLRGRAADLRGRRGRHRAPQGGRDHAGGRDRSRIAFRQRPRPGTERAAGARRDRHRPRQASRPGWRRAAQRGPDRDAVGRRVQRRARRR